MEASDKVVRFGLSEEAHSCLEKLADSLEISLDVLISKSLAQYDTIVLDAKRKINTGASFYIVAANKNQTIEEILLPIMFGSWQYQPVPQDTIARFTPPEHPSKIINMSLPKRSHSRIVRLVELTDAADETEVFRNAIILGTAVFELISRYKGTKVSTYYKILRIIPKS